LKFNILHMDAIILGTEFLIEKACGLLGRFENIDIVSRVTVDGEVSAVDLKAKLKETTANKLFLAVPNHMAETIAAHIRDIYPGEVFYIPHYAFDLLHPKPEDILIPIDVYKPRLSYLEFHVCDHCNLNCKGCSHYSNIAEKGVFADIDSYSRDIRRLRELFWGITTIRLMGGEPLLNKELNRFVEITREVFPDADLRVVTNGLLIPYIDPELACAMNKNHCGFDITLYEPTANILESIEKALDKHKIQHNISNKVDKFFRMKTLKPVNDPKKAATLCVRGGCYFLMEGCLAKCVEPILIEKVNRWYSTDFTSEDVHYIHDPQIDPWELKKQLAGPIDFRRYCLPFYNRFRWEQCGANEAKLEDWFIPIGKARLLGYGYFLLTIIRRVLWKTPRLKRTLKKLVQ